jgi:hypothetical protein
MRIKKFSEFKKRKKTKIKKIEDFNYNFIPISNPNSPAPTSNISVKSFIV